MPISFKEFLATQVIVDDVTPWAGHPSWAGTPGAVFLETYWVYRDGDLWKVIIENGVHEGNLEDVAERLYDWYVDNVA